MTPRPRSRVRAGEEGFALITVIGAMFVLSLFALGSLGVALKSLPQSRFAQDTAAAFAAAQSGVDDLLARLNACDAYWTVPDPLTVCPSAAPDLALNGSATGTWATISGSSPARPARYRYRFVSTPDVTPGLLRVEATGNVNGVTRTMSVDLTRPSFLNYVYYTDFETNDPLTQRQTFAQRRYKRFRTRAVDGNIYTYHNVRFTGLTDAQVAACDRYWYGPGGARPVSVGETYKYAPASNLEPEYEATAARTCDIAFQGAGSAPDVLRGPMHTNDAILLNGGPVQFLDTAHTAWPAGSNPAPSPTAWYRATNGGAPSGNAPAYTAPVNMPESAPEETISAARRGGCLFTGPTWIEYLSTGQMRVQSPFSRNLPANGSCGPNGNGTVQPPVTVAGPGNGVVYVQGLSADAHWNSRTCTGAALEVLNRYPLAEDVTRYDCRAGDAFVKGLVQRPSTVYAANNIIITDDIRYVTGAPSAVLGLMAESMVNVYHPVRCNLALDPALNQSEVRAPWSCPPDLFENIPNAAGAERTTLSNLVVHAAILSREHSFSVQNYEKGQPLGTLTVVGGIYQRYRGIVFTSNWWGQTGYTKDYSYDPRLRILPPPAFMPPKNAVWVVTSTSEQRS